MWRDNLKKIRRFLRDPNANIWSDGLLKRAFNDNQSDFSEKVGLLEKIEAIRNPPMYQMSYMFPWEWKYMSHDGKEYNCFKFHQQGSWVCSFKWETQELGFTTAAGTDEGDAFTHPFEGFMVSNTNARIPMWFPEDFKTTKFIAFNKEPLEYLTKKVIQSDDASWKSQSGKPTYYYREDSFSNEFYLYPMPSTVVWDDVDGDALNGMVLFSDDQDPNQEIGTILDMIGIVDNQNDGIVTDVVEHDNNVLLIYDGYAMDLESQDDESQYPKFLQKYIEYGTLEQAYSANTDGRIGSLKDYWKWRKELGLSFVQKFKFKRLADRDFRLVSQDGGSKRTRKGPRLPDEYPRTYP